MDGFAQNGRRDLCLCHSAHPNFHDVSTHGGVLLSYTWDVPTGSAIVLLSTGIFFGAAVAETSKARCSLQPAEDSI
jgi:hypothetical protein